MPKPTAKDATSDAEPTPESVLLILRKRLANEERPAGTPSAIVALVIGEEPWVVDLREGLTADAVVRRGEPDAPADVKVSIAADDFMALYEGRLSIFKALTTKRLRVDGDMRLLRSVETAARIPTPA